MKTTLKLFGISLMIFVLPSCGSNADSDCKIGNVVIDCKNAEVYNDYINKEQSINSSFDRGAKKLSFDEKLELRQSLISCYELNKEVLESVYSKVKDSVFGARQPLEIYEMRSEELGYLIEEGVRIEEAKAFTKTLNIKQYEVDTVLYEGADKSRYLFMEIQNTSDKSITGIAINKIYERNGEDIQPDMVTNYLLSEDMIRPREEGKSVVRPNETLILSFETTKDLKAKPEIYSYSFEKE